MLAPKDTKVEILDLAENFLRDHGFNGFSYANISSAVHIKNAAVHYYFSSKADLGVAVIQRARERLFQWTQEQMVVSKTPAEKLEAFFRRYLNFLEAGQQVCLGGGLETDFKTLPSLMQVETQKFASDILAWMEEFLSKGKKSTFLPFRER